MITRDSGAAASNMFFCASLSPIDLAHPRLAVETARAGGVGLLDAVHMRADRVECARTNLERLFDVATHEGPARIGLRLRATQRDLLAPLLGAGEGLPHWLLVSGWEPHELPLLLATLARPGREIWLEIGSRAELDGVDPSLIFAGWVGRGAECGGLTGTESAFILSQHLARQRRPFLIRGGIGIHSAAACRVAGAAGVILDDALLLMKESPLAPHWQYLIGHFGLTDTVVIGRGSGAPVRVVERPDAPVARELRTRLEAIDTAEPTGAADWLAAVNELVAWDDPTRRAWPLGENSGSAGQAAKRYRTVGRLVRAVLDAVDSHVEIAAQAAALESGAPLARSHGTRYPIVQGPMTRVSDRVEFAAAVASAGALPLFALALMRAPEVRALLDAADARLKGGPWGVGILGFVPPELRDEQLEIVERIKPPFALIAGGRPDQARQLETQGIPTYLHAPAPLVVPFLGQGAKRLVFEGGECGGHVGPLHSFSLWDFVVDTLAERVPAADAAGMHVLFAGGIHDALSAAMVAALAAPLSAAGMKVGVLMGTAYLFTEEAVENTAITRTFQRQAISSTATALIETGPGHVIRCAPTRFTETFADERRLLRQSGLSGHALREALEMLVVGRSRIASKGLLRHGDRLVPVDEGRQLGDGLYMLGDAAALRSLPTTMTALHAEVSVDGTARLRAAADAARVPGAMPAPSPADVAIIGASCLLPGASDVDTFWRNLLDQKGAITEIPRERWDWRLYFDPDPAARDRIYSKWGGFVDPIPFDPLRFGIPPRSLASIAIPQLIALELTRRALGDAGFGDTIPDDRVRARTAVIFGTGNTADVEELYMTRATLPLILPQIGNDILDRLPEWTEESYPGLLANVVAGRVANRFDLGGLNVSLDAACASSLAALDLAVRELAERRSDLVIAGGIEFDQSPQGYMGFSRTRALSPRGRADVFDRQADGIVISEGGVVVVLKRLADAERDGDRIYAVIKAVAGSSDGRGLSLTAPKPQGQRLAIDRAYSMAGIDPGTLGLYEAHGTGTAVGDAAEVETICRALADHGGAAEGCVIGSAKSLVGHTRTAAGMVALLKTALALHHGVLPPHAGVTRPLEAFGAANTPLKLLSAAQPWLSGQRGPRRAGVSAFGFGGTNYHAVLEEHGDATPAGAIAWPVELFVVSGSSSDSLGAGLDRLDRAARAIEERSQRGEPAPFTLRDLAYVCGVTARSSDPSRAALIAGTATDLRARIREAVARLSSEGQMDGRDVRLGSGAATGRLAFLFPGQGSQYPGMGSELALFAPEARACMETADAILHRLPDRLSRIVMPGAAFDEAATARQKRRLADTRVAQPAIGTVSCAMLDLARRVRIEPDCTAGHSYGELVALHAAGSLGRDDLLRLSETRGLAMSEVGADAGTMAMVALSEAGAAAYLDQGRVVTIANLNAPDQVVISGTSAAVAATVDRLRVDGHVVVPLPVAAAFHSPLMSPARPVLEAALAALRIETPLLPVYANLDGQPYPAQAAAIRTRLAAHLEQRVDFIAQVEAMYADGVRTFVELGPGHVLTGLVKRILGPRPHVAVSADGGLHGWLGLMAQVFAAGHPIDVASLFADRPVRWVDLDRLPESQGVAPGWYLDGGRVWKRDGGTRSAGRTPFLDQESAEISRLDFIERTAGLPAQAMLQTTGHFSPILEVYRDYEVTMRQFLDQQERMLKAVLERESVVSAGMLPPPASLDRASEAPSPPPPPPAIADVAPARVPAAPQDAESSPRDRLLGLLLGIVSDRTGYAIDMLGLDLDLEADLGIDSIKRIEIIATLTSALPATEAVRIQDQMDRLSRRRSLRAMADLLMSAFAEPGAKAAEPPSPAPGPGARFVMRPYPKPLDTARKSRLAGLHLITEDALGLASLLANRLRSMGADACVIAVDDLAQPARLTRAVADLRNRHGRVNGILHAAPVGRALDNGARTIDGRRREAAITTKRLFQLVHECAGDLEHASNGPVILAVTSMGGNWGRVDPGLPGSEMAGGCHGLLRTVARELPGVRTSVIDVDGGSPVDELAACVEAEYVASESDSEVGYRRGVRSVYLAEAASWPAVGPTTNDWRPRAGWTVLATGGSRGITAELCRELAAPDVRFVLVGRGPLAGSPASPDIAERQRHIDALRTMGAEVEYHGIDVRDEGDFGALIGDVYRRCGRIDAVLHGAGIIDDRRLESKSADSFDRVFDTKVDGALTLASHLRPDGLKWIVFLGSISGRFGNPGQVDYAAANETLNRIAWTLKRQWRSTRVVSINWGPWRGTGMASEAVQTLLSAQGIQLIDPEAGRRFFAGELDAGTMDDVEIVAADGPWRTAHPSVPESVRVLRS